MITTKICIILKCINYHKYLELVYIVTSKPKQTFEKAIGDRLKIYNLKEM